MKSIGYYQRQPSVVRRRALAAAGMRLGRLEYGLMHNLRDRNSELGIARELRSIAADYASIATTLTVLVEDDLPEPGQSDRQAA